VEAIGVEEGQSVAVDGGGHLGGSGDDLGGDLGVDGRVVMAGAGREDLGVGDVQELGGGLRA
jgi:hypothetical protein